jgi:hypothetical protein
MYSFVIFINAPILRNLETMYFMELVSVYIIELLVLVKFAVVHDILTFSNVFMNC